MINILDRIDDFLIERDPKERYALYIFMIILIGVVYYFFNYKLLYGDLQHQKRIILHTKQKYDIKPYEKKLKIKQNKLNDLKGKISNLKESIAYVQSLIESIKNIKFFVKDNDLFSFLKNVFSFSIKKSLFPSYTINKQKKLFLKEYVIKIKGYTSIRNFINFILMLRYIEKSNYIATFDEVEFKIFKHKKGGIFSDYNSTVSIWSYQ